MHASKNSAPVLVATVVAVLMVFVVASSPANAAPVPASSTPVASWSYGAVKTVSVGPVTASDGWTYEGNVTFGYTVTIYDNNTSANTFELTIHRTMGVAFSVRFCLPSCSSPSEWANESYRAWETTTAFSNFTTQGVVQEGNDATVPAVALENSTVFLRANVTETSDVFLKGEAGPHTHYLSAALAGDSLVDFSPALGLFPTDLTQGSSWSNTSAFVESGAGTYSYYYAAHTPFKNTVIGPVSGAISFATSGNVTVLGSYPAGSTISLGGVSYPAITLTVIGPFSVREGVVFVPSSVDLFGSASQPWAADANGTVSAQPSTLDLKISPGGHVQLAASSWKFGSDSANAADASSVASSSAGPTPAASTTNPVSSGTIQGEPESAAQSVSSQQCLTGGVGCPGTSGGSTSRSVWGDVVLVGAIATIGALVAMAVVTRWRKLPPPAYLNATLYPPGQSLPPAPRGTPAKPAAPPPAEDDPLDHLW